jgi:hypothetical protein
MKPQPLRLTVVAIALFAGCLSALAQADVIIKQRAKELRDQNNVRQGVPPPTQPAAPPAARAAAAPQSPSLQRFQAGLAAFKANVPATDAQKEQLARDLVAVAQGAKPSLATARKFASDFAAACLEKPLPSASRARLVQEIDAVLNPAKYPNAKPEGIFADIQAILQENGTARSQAIAVANDVKALAAEVQKAGGGS